MSRTICVVTGTRAEYGLLRWVMEGVRAHPELRLQVAVTGMHLSPEFGLTVREIEADGLLAVCVQHEMDHLAGKVFVEYLSMFKRTRIKTKSSNRFIIVRRDGRPMKNK